MLFLLSPAKTLDYDTPAGDLPHTDPEFIPQSTRLIDGGASQPDRLVFRRDNPAMEAA